MVEKYNIRTDLALEEKERFESDQVEVQGVILTEEYDEKIRFTSKPSGLKRKTEKK